MYIMYGKIDGDYVVWGSGKSEEKAIKDADKHLVDFYLGDLENQYPFISKNGMKTTKEAFLDDIYGYFKLRLVECDKELAKWVDDNGGSNVPMIVIDGRARLNKKAVAKLYS